MTRFAIGIIVLSGAFAAVFLSASSQTDESPEGQRSSQAIVEPNWNLLAYLDNRIAEQESQQDVRCWSSVSKLQMFIAESYIEPRAISMRIDMHKQLIESIWRNAQQHGGASPVIDERTVAAVLRRRFFYPTVRDGSFHFTLSTAPHEIIVKKDDVMDYDDTIESWRLLQSWALMHTNAQGKLSLSPQFSESATNVLSRFLVVYDVAVMRYAHYQATASKKSLIDEDVIKQAMALEENLKIPDTR